MSTCEVKGIADGGHPDTIQGLGQQANSHAPGAGPRAQQLRGVQIDITIIASSHQQHLPLQHYNQSHTISPPHHFSIGHIAATSMVVSPHIERWQVCNPALSPIPAVQYSTVQNSTVQPPSRTWKPLCSFHDLQLPPPLQRMGLGWSKLR